MRNVLLGLLAALIAGIYVLNAVRTGAWGTVALVAGGGLAVIAALFWLRKPGGKDERAGIERAQRTATALGGDATGAQAANGWRCHGAGWDITWQVLRGREGMGVRENGAGLPSAEPAALIRDDGAIHKVFVSVPCAAPGPMAWSFRREPLEPGVAPGEIFVGEGPGGMVQVSEDDLLIYKSAQKGRAEAEREARRLLDEQLVRIGRSVRTGHPEFDAPIRSRAANPAELARRVAAPETRSAIDALLRFSAPFAADLAVRDGRLTWECYGTTRTTGDGWKRLVAELTRLAGRLDG